MKPKIELSRDLFLDLMEGLSLAKIFLRDHGHGEVVNQLHVLVERLRDAAEIELEFKKPFDPAPKTYSYGEALLRLGGLQEGCAIRRNRHPGLFEYEETLLYGRVLIYFDPERRKLSPDWVLTDEDQRATDWQIYYRSD